MTKTPNTSHWTGATEEWSGSFSHITYLPSVSLSVEDLDDADEFGFETPTSEQVTAVSSRLTKRNLAQLSAVAA